MLLPSNLDRSICIGRLNIEQIDFLPKVGLQCLVGSSRLSCFAVSVLVRVDCMITSELYF